MCLPADVQVTAEHLKVMQTFAPLEILIAYLLFYDFDVCGGAVLLDGGQSETPAKLFLEDCEIRNTQASHAGGAIAQFGTSHIELTRTLVYASSAVVGAYVNSVGSGPKNAQNIRSTYSPSLVSQVKCRPPDVTGPYAAGNSLVWTSTCCPPRQTTHFDY